MDNTRSKKTQKNTKLDHHRQGYGRNVAVGVIMCVESVRTVAHHFSHLKWIGWKFGSQNEKTNLKIFSGQISPVRKECLNDLVWTTLHPEVGAWGTVGDARSWWSILFSNGTFFSFGFTSLLGALCRLWSPEVQTRDFCSSSYFPRSCCCKLWCCCWQCPNQLVSKHGKRNSKSNSKRVLPPPKEN